MKRKTKNKKALSEMVSYVLLIVIAIGLAAGVYAWLRGYLPSSNPRETCSEDASLSIEKYTCSEEQITLTIKNNGLFNINGFFIRGTDSENENAVPTSSLECEEQFRCTITGRYDFPENFNPNELKEVNFFYSQETETKPLKKIQVQPFVKSRDSKKILLCSNTLNLKIEGCD
jgi:FlaG/FlaF family flagellin (archaellin)